MAAGIPSIRDLFALPPEKNGMVPVELRALTHGVPPKKVADNLALFFEEWRVSGVDAWNNLAVSGEVFLVGDESKEEKELPVGWWNLPEVIGDRIISRLLHVPTGTCIMLQNATQIMFGILSCEELHRPGRRKVICTDGEFPSVLHSIAHDRKRFAGFSQTARDEVAFDHRVIDIGDGAFDATRILSEIDDSTALVALSHVGFVRGERIPNGVIKLITEKAHRHGALVAIDGYHALGGELINVSNMGVDLYFGGLLKEGCGSSGCCFLYIRPGLELHPSLSGWFGDGEPFAFKLAPSSHSDCRRRFLLGTTPVASLYHGVEGAKIMLRAGLELVRDDVFSKVTRFIDKCRSGGVTVVSTTDRERMSALIVLKIPEANLFREYIIAKHGIYVDARRNQFIRLAPHLYNSAEEIDRAAEVIVNAAKNRDYLSFVPATKGGPVT